MPHLPLDLRKGFIDEFVSILYTHNTRKYDTIIPEYKKVYA
jgi:hypothetical protein